MVLDELKRVSSDRDAYKQKLSAAEKSAKEAWDEVANLRDLNGSKDKPEKGERTASGSHSEDGTTVQDLVDGDPLGATTKSPPSSIKSPTISVPGMSLFSPKPKATECQQGSEDFFSYDSEIPRLENELQEKQMRINGLENEVKSLKGDLAVTRESTQSMVQTLEEATLELNSLRDTKERLESEKKEQNEEKIKGLRQTISNMENELTELRASSQKDEKRIDTLNSLISTLRNQLTEAQDKNQDLNRVIERSSKRIEQLEDRKIADSSQSVARTESASVEALTQGPQSTSYEVNNPQDTSNAGKKKNKKKKKGGKAPVEQDKVIQSELGKEASPSAEESKEPEETGTLSKLQDELRQLRVLLEEKDAAMDSISSKLKDQDGLQEEIGTLRDDLVNLGSEHVEAKDKVKQLLAEKTALENTLTSLEKELVELRGAQASSAAGSEQKHNDIAAQFEDLKTKATTLQLDLSAAQQLASSRFKDLNDLRNVLQKAQPEINALRSEAAEVKSIKEALERKDAEFKRLDSRHEEMRSEVTGLKQTIANRESDIKTLNQKIAQESSGKLKAEEAGSKAAQDVQRLETEKRQANEALDRLSKELSRVREELLSNKSRLKEIEQQFSKTRSDSEGLKEEIELKSAQYASAQSLMASMRDQTAEMAMQMKEARERCESLDEEVAEAHRLLGERSREGETMRRLLADVEGRADARTREMKERMDTAIEERDRAEDEASTAGRRRARELEDLRNKYRDLERSLKRAEEDKEELEIAQKDWKRRREELEHRAGQSAKEVDEVRKAMGELRDALDESERQARDLEKQKAELRRSVEDTQLRLEKLQKSNKVCSFVLNGLRRVTYADYAQTMADEISKIQTSKTKAMDSSAQSSRSSLDSVARLGSPTPQSRNTSAALLDAPNGQPPGAMDYVYLKNVLLQFLEQKDKKHQMQLIPVLGMLLHFDRWVVLHSYSVVFSILIAVQKRRAEMDVSDHDQGMISAGILGYMTAKGTREAPGL
jgi:chromosome segregation ATPase